MRWDAGRTADQEGCGRIRRGAGLAQERLKPPQRLRKAPQTARGFNCTYRWRHSRFRRHEPSAQADIALSQPRIHSPRRGRGNVSPAPQERLKPPRRRNDCGKPRKLRGASNAVRGGAALTISPARTVRAGGHRVVPAANSFATAGAGQRQPRAARAAEAAAPPQRLRKAPQTTRGFNCSTGGGTHDIAGTNRPRRRTSRCPSREFIRRGGGGATSAPRARAAEAAESASLGGGPVVMPARSFGRAEGSRCGPVPRGASSGSQRFPWRYPQTPPPAIPYPLFPIPYSLLPVPCPAAPRSARSPRPTGETRHRRTRPPPARRSARRRWSR